MRFLLFNAVVGTALVYLLFGGFENIPTDEIAERVQNVASRGGEAVIEVYRESSSGAPESRQPQMSAIQRPAPVQTAPNPMTAPAPNAATLADNGAANGAPNVTDNIAATVADNRPGNAAATVASIAPPTVTESNEPLPVVEVAEQIAVPSRIERSSPAVSSTGPRAPALRAEILADAVQGSDDPAATAAFMTPRERRRELLRLAEEMELRSLEELSR